MKTRLYGLLALVLCAMMVIAPAGALGADGAGNTQINLTVTNGATGSGGFTATLEVGQLIVPQQGTAIVAEANAVSSLQLVLKDGAGKEIRDGKSSDTNNSNPDNRKVTLTLDVPESNKVWRVSKIYTAGTTDGYAAVTLDEVTVTMNPEQIGEIGDKDVYIIGTELGAGYTFKGQINKATTKKYFDSYFQDKGYTCVSSFDLGAYTNPDSILYTPAGLPSNEVSITLPWPSDTNAKPGEYLVSHIYDVITNEDGGYTAPVKSYTDADSNQDGIQITVSTLSPFGIGYKANVENTLTYKDGKPVQVGDIVYHDTEITYTNSASQKLYLKKTIGANSSVSTPSANQTFAIAPTAVGAKYEVTAIVPNYDYYGTVYGFCLELKIVSSGAPGGGNAGGGVNPGGNAGGGVPAPSTPSTPNLPQTGDNSQLVLWFALAALSLAGAAVILRRKKA